MKLRIAFALLVGSSAAAVGCFQTIDNGVVGGPPDSNSTASSSGGVAIGTLVDAGLPDAFANFNPTQQCPPGSALCYQLCNSPECATTEGGINGNIVLPPDLQTPAFILPDGGQSTDPCAQLEAESMRIRTNSCSQCHGAGGHDVWQWVLDDNQLATTPGPGLTPPAPLVVPGNPAASYLLQKIALGISNRADPSGMPLPPSNAAQNIDKDAAATIVYPTPEDYSLMYAWILACAPGADAGSYQGMYGGGNYGPAGGSTTSVKADGGH